MAGLVSQLSSEAKTDKTTDKTTDSEVHVNTLSGGGSTLSGVALD